MARLSGTDDGVDPTVLDRLHESLDRARVEVAALAVAARDPRTPRVARLVAGATVALALSPLDPIPDVVPVLGHLDDVVIVPPGVALAWRLTPTAVRDDARSRAREVSPGLGAWIVAALVALGWVAVTLLVSRLAVGWP